MNIPLLNTFLIAIVGIIVPVAFSALVVRVLKKLEDINRDYHFIWRGIILRGFMEAERTGNIERCDSTWKISDRSRQAYADIADGLRTLYQAKSASLSRSPTDDELAWEIEMKYQDWMLGNVCQILGVSQHGCTAIASIIAREDPATETRSAVTAVDETRG